MLPPEEPVPLPGGTPATIEARGVGVLGGELKCGRPPGESFAAAVGGSVEPRFKKEATMEAAADPAIPPPSPRGVLCVSRFVGRPDITAAGDVSVTTPARA